jgi:DNA-binding transcriptional LysR family regulator
MERTELERLSRYDRATVGLWARSHAELDRQRGGDPGPSGQACQAWLLEAAVHAVLAGLGGCREPAALFARYEADAAADFALIGSLVAGPAGDLPWRVRDAAFHLRWRELTGAG